MAKKKTSKSIRAPQSAKTPSVPLAVSAPTIPTTNPQAGQKQTVRSKEFRSRFGL